MYTYFTTLILVIHMSSCSAENAASPVYEVINEQARSDDKWSEPGPERLPYGNPLAGNSLQNARLHAANQQAMFNAERMRQHRAQLQRWNKAPIKDSYMRAYHESQENHQLALEQQEGGANRTHPARSPSRRHRINLRRNKGLDPKKLTAADAIQNIRNHRSYGSNQNDYNNIDQLYQTIRLSPGPTYDEGVTIKPNGNVGVTGLKQTEDSQLLTRAVPSVTQVYTKQFRNIQNYESAKDIETLNMLINKDDSQKQFTALNDILFHVNNEPENSMYNYILEDHRPITEVIDDLEDPSIRKPYKSPNQSKELVTTPNTNTMPVYYPANSPGDKVEIPNGAPLKQNEAEHVVQTHVVSTGVQHLNEDGGPYDEVSIKKHFNRHIRSTVNEAENFVITRTPMINETDARQRLPGPLKMYKHNRDDDETEEEEDNEEQSEDQSEAPPEAQTKTFEEWADPTAPVGSTTLLSIQNSPIKPQVRPKNPAVQVFHKPRVYYPEDRLLIENVKETSLIGLEPLYLVSKQRLMNLLGYHARKHNDWLYQTRPLNHLYKLRYAANYEFGYHVRDHETGNDFGHHEAKINGNTNGHYHVLLPDGRMQRVRYFAGPEGFHADISYDFQ